VDIARGTRLGAYEIESAIGAGGMGEVYKGRDTRLDRTVAIKVLPPHWADSPEMKQRFEREAQAIASLNHPHICTLHDIGHEPAPSGSSALDFLVMEFLDGETLAARLERGPLPRSALNTLSAYAKRYEELINTQMLTERILADMLFHLKLAEFSGNRYVVRLLAQTFERSALKRRHEGYRYDRSTFAATEHTRLLDALAKHDKRAAMQVLRKHVQSARDALLSQLYEVPPLSFDPI